MENHIEQCRNLENRVLWISTEATWLVGLKMPGLLGVLITFLVCSIKFQLLRRCRLDSTTSVAFIWSWLVRRLSCISAWDPSVIHPDPHQKKKIHRATFEWKFAISVRWSKKPTEQRVLCHWGSLQGNVFAAGDCHQGGAYPQERAADPAQTGRRRRMVPTPVASDRPIIPVWPLSVTESKRCGSAKTIVRPCCGHSFISHYCVSIAPPRFVRIISILRPPIDATMATNDEINLRSARTSFPFTDYSGALIDNHPSSTQNERKNKQDKWSYSEICVEQA